MTTQSFAPAVRSVVEPALAKARAAPRDAAAVGRLGMVLHAHEQLATARTCYLRASRLDPGRFEWLYYLGVVSEGQEAVAPLRSALRLRDYLPARLRLGEVLLARGEAASAARLYEGREHPAALFGFGRATGNPAYYERALAGYPTYGAAMFALAQHYRRVGRAAEAERLMAGYPRFQTTVPPVDDPLMQAVKALRRSAAELVRQAAELDAQGQTQRAAELHLQALQLEPKMAQAHINLISLYTRLGQLDKAEKHYKRAVKINANAPEAHYNFGVLCYRSERRREARSAFEKTLAIDPRHARAHNNLGVLLQEEGKLDEAAQHFREAIEVQPGYALARFQLGRIYANQARFSEAIEQFQRAAAVEDDSTPAYLYALGATQARAGERTAAAATLAAAQAKAVARGQSELVASIRGDLERLKR